MKDKLKPCPFCGGEAKIDGKSDYCRVRCLKCDALGSSVYFDYQEDQDYSRFEEQAIFAWNTRADGWIKVEDRLPEESETERVLTFVPKYYEPIQATFYSKRIHPSPELKGWWAAGVTHWQPLPPAPEGE